MKKPKFLTVPPLLFLCFALSIAAKPTPSLHAKGPTSMPASRSLFRSAPHKDTLQKRIDAFRKRIGKRNQTQRRKRRDVFKQLKSQQAQRQKKAEKEFALALRRMRAAQRKRNQAQKKWREKTSQTLGNIKSRQQKLATMKAITRTEQKLASLIKSKVLSSINVVKKEQLRQKQAIALLIKAYARRKPGQRMKLKGLPNAYARWIPRGLFQMGATIKEIGSSSDEKPQHWVLLRKGYWMMETEVTQKQYKALTGETPSTHKNCAQCPVETVNWHEAANFANKLSSRQKLELCFECKRNKNKIRCKAKNQNFYISCNGWRLPTEAEWERAYRGGTSTPFYTGNCINGDQANIDGRHKYAQCKAEKESHGSTQEVLQIKDIEETYHPWGLDGMAGNVSEWVFDRYGPYKQGYVVDPTGNRKDQQRLIRGGAYLDSMAEARASQRFKSGKGPSSHKDVGFRLVRIDLSR